MKVKFKKIIFVVPEPDSFISGGNIYNLHFLKALRRFDPTVVNIDFATFQSRPESSEEVLYFFDSIYFENLKTYQGDLAHTFLIAHHLESLNQKEENRFPFFKKEEKSVLDRFGGFLSTSPFTQKYLSSLGYEKVMHLNLPPALTFKANPRKQSGPKIQALMVNNLIERKGLLELFDYLNKSNLSASQFQLTLIGGEHIEPAYAAKCREMLNTPRLQQLVNYIGLQNRETVMQYFEQSNLYISTAYMETFGIALQEAVAYRLPILAYDGGSADYHIEPGQNGHLFTTINEMVQKLDELAVRPNEFDDLIESAWQFRKFENYNWQTVIQLFVQQLIPLG